MLRNLIALRKVNDTHGHDAADQALYSAKLQGRSRSITYSIADNQSAARRTLLSLLRARRAGA